jgi:anti-sigma factor RsiW
MSEGLRSLPEPSAPAGLTEELLRLARRRRERTPSFWEALRLTWRIPAATGLASAMALGAGFLVFTRFLSAGAEELSLNEVLAAHSRYALTMPAADRETLYAGLAGEQDDDR